MLENDEERNKIGDFYNKYESVFIRYALKITNDMGMAEDAVHNSFVSIIEHKSKWNELSTRDFLKYSVIIVKNKSIDQLRCKKLYCKIPVEEIEMYFDTNDEAIDDRIIREETYSFIYKQIDSLDEISKQILEMKYCAEMSYKEIANELGVNRKFVDNHIMSAKAKIRRLIKGEVTTNDK